MARGKLCGERLRSGSGSFITSSACGNNVYLRSSDTVKTLKRKESSLLNALRSLLKVCIGQNRFSFVSVYLGKISHRMEKEMEDGDPSTAPKQVSPVCHASGVPASVKHAV